MRKLALVLALSLLASCGDVDDDQAKVRIVNALYDYNTLDLVVGNKIKVDDLPYGERSVKVRIGVTNREGEDPSASTTTTVSGGSSTSSTSSTSTSTLPVLAAADVEATTTTVSSTTTTTTATTVPTGTRTLLVFVDSVATRLIQQEVKLIAQQRYTMYAYESGGADSARLIVEQETKQKLVRGKLKLRVADMAPSSGDVDVYVLGTGQSVQDVPAARTGLSPSEVSSYVDVAPGERSVALTRTGTKTEVFNSGPVELVAGTLATMVVLEKKKGGGPGLGYLLTAD